MYQDEVTLTFGTPVPQVIHEHILILSANPCTTITQFPHHQIRATPNNSQPPTSHAPIKTIMPPITQTPILHALARQQPLHPKPTFLTVRSLASSSKTQAIGPSSQDPQSRGDNQSAEQRAASSREPSFRPPPGEGCAEIGPGADSAATGARGEDDGKSEQRKRAIVEGLKGTNLSKDPRFGG
jgi:hypothetical protein